MRLAGAFLYFLSAFARPASVDATAGQPAPAPEIAASRPADPERGWPSLTGSGLIWLPDTSTLRRGRVDFAFGFDNHDRDPLKMDVLDLKAAWTAGIGRRFEAYGHFVVARAVTVSPRPSLFPSPIDLIVPEGHPVPQRPYYPIYTPIPYVNRKGRSQLGRFNLGDAVIGVKRTLWEPDGARPGVALSGELKFPLTRALPDLQSGSGTGGIDERVRLTAQWGTGRHSLVASSSYTYVGQGAWGDQLIVFTPSGEAVVTEQPLLLASNVVLGAGYRAVVSPNVAVVAEVTKMAEVGGRTRAFRVPGPVDVTAGFQLRWRDAGALLCLRYHANSVGHSEQQWPLAGLADLGDVSDEDRVAYLSAIGAAGALPHLRRNSQIALAVPASGPPLPPGTRILPPSFTMGPHGEIAYVIVFSWSVGTPRRH